MDKNEYKPYCPGCTKKPTIHITQIVNGQVTEMHLCSECPLLKTYALEQPFGLAALLGGLVGGVPQEGVKPSEELKCKHCGLTYQEFSNSGRLGCSECYEAFKGALSVLLKNIHGSDYHVGKAPLKSPLMQVNRIERLLQLKDQMDQAVKNENYERAAKLRDMIRQMENKEREKQNLN